MFLSILTYSTAALKLSFYFLLGIGGDAIVFETDVDKISNQIFFEEKNTFSLPEDVIKRLSIFKKCISFNKNSI